MSYELKLMLPGAELEIEFDNLDELQERLTALDLPRLQGMLRDALTPPAPAESAPATESAPAAESTPAAEDAAPAKKAARKSSKKAAGKSAKKASKKSAAKASGKGAKKASRKSSKASKSSKKAA